MRGSQYWHDSMMGRCISWCTQPITLDRYTRPRWAWLLRGLVVLGVIVLVLYGVAS